jgi:hypothetical protein
MCELGVAWPYAPSRRNAPHVWNTIGYNVTFVLITVSLAAIQPTASTAETPCRPHPQQQSPLPNSTLLTQSSCNLCHVGAPNLRNPLSAEVGCFVQAHMSMSYDEGFATRARRFVSETFGLCGSKNITSWVLAGAAAYYLFYLPEKQRALEIQVRFFAMEGRWGGGGTGVGGGVLHGVGVSAQGSVRIGRQVHHTTAAGMRHQPGIRRAGPTAQFGGVSNSAGVMEFVGNNACSWDVSTDPLQCLSGDGCLHRHASRHQPFRIKPTVAAVAYGWRMPGTCLVPADRA